MIEFVLDVYLTYKKIIVKEVSNGKEELNIILYQDLNMKESKCKQYMN